MALSGSNLKLLIQAGNHICALPLSDVLETMRPLPIEPLRGAPQGVAGVSLVRGAPVPVVDLAVLLGSETASCHRFVSLRVDERTVVLAVNRVIGIHEIPAARMTAMPPLLGAVQPAMIAAISALDSGLVLVLRSAGLVPGEEAWAAQEA